MDNDDHKLDRFEAYYCDQCKTLTYPAQHVNGLVCDCPLWWEDREKQPRPPKWVEVIVEIKEAI